MKVLVIGSGAREHALAWKLKQSPKVTRIFCAPGNPGIERCATLVPIAVHQVSELATFAEKEKIDLTIVGPELPLTLGIVDHFTEKKLAVFGPTAKAAQLEGSKDFAKEIMLAAKVPTAAYQVCLTAAELHRYVISSEIPIVIKADGLASGKGVFVCKTREEAFACIAPLFNELKAEKVIVEQFLEGVEASFIVATDGSRIIPLATAHDYKRIFDRDQGPNTGGMGTVSPTPRLTKTQEAWAVEHVIRPVLAEMHRRGVPFSGFLYAGLMIARDGTINTLEFNARLGDPETQVIMRRLDSDVAELLLALATGTALPEIRWSESHAQCVVLAASGYPEHPRSGDTISGINLAESLTDIAIFHAGTARVAPSGELVTAGGRVLSVTAAANSAHEARALCYRAVDMIQFKGVQVRRDIGAL